MWRYESALATPDAERFLATLNAHAGFFAPERPVVVGRAPGRLDLMGGIADYSGALVLELPLALATFAAVQGAPEPAIVVRSLGASDLGAAPDGKPIKNGQVSLNYADGLCLSADIKSGRVSFGMVPAGEVAYSVMFMTADQSGHPCEPTKLVLHEGERDVPCDFLAWEHMSWECSHYDQGLTGMFGLALSGGPIEVGHVPEQLAILRDLKASGRIRVVGATTSFDRQYADFEAMMQQAMQLIRTITPFLTGALVAWFGARLCYVIDGFSFLFSALMIAPLVINRVQTAAATEKKASVGSIISEFGAGMKFILTHANISFVIIALTAGMFAISCFGPLMAVFVRDNLKAGEILFGIASSLIGVGMILCTLAINQFAKSRSKSQMVIEGLMVIGLSVAVMAGFGNIPMALIGMFGIGIGSGLIMIPSMTLIQSETPMEMVGRVSSSVWSLLSIAQVIGLIFSGSLAENLRAARPEASLAELRAALQAEQGYRACVRWLTITDVATKQPSYVTDPNGQVYQLGSDFRLWQYSPGLLGSQPC